MRSGKKPILSNQNIYQYVVSRLSIGWIPEQICGRSKLEKQPFNLSFVTIYRAVHCGLIPTFIKKKMRFMNKHKKHNSLNDNRGKIPNTVKSLKTSIPLDL